MRILAAVALFLLIASPLHAQTLTPQDARATLTVARAQATAASELRLIPANEMLVGCSGDGTLTSPSGSNDVDDWTSDW